MDVERAGLDDIDDLVGLRLAYLLEDNGQLGENETAYIQKCLPGYYQAHLGKDLFVYAIRERQAIVSCAFLLVIEKPMSPSFLNGRTATVLNVYTRPSYRRKGYAKRIMNALLADAQEKDICVIDLRSTEDGYSLYQSVGFVDDHSKYHLMKWVNQ